MHALVDSIEYGLIQAGSVLPSRGDEGLARAPARASDRPKVRVEVGS